jgi:hypothetical protein
MSQEKVELAKRAADAYNRRDVDTFFAELATPDLEWWPALTRAFEGACYQGREGIERFVAILPRTGRSSRRSLRSSAISATACSCSAGSRDVEEAAASRSMRQ